ncbi:putative protein kinase-like [Acanthamoeba polyphaga mimivirus]|uniref:ABC1 atypical kinase-like domain-containing protein n=1 Tax=Acanthamoeba polyphaga mimivirus Kroon TaxID=3069720 RepID=A0A0G2YBH1_9VIRU|nr:putative protein kinase-like [Acanthamoeba polyphaga mimivirus]AKI80441.1 putative protein kinase-like [Acanthamoeba polyphaga mimivirus Kroon]
MSTSCLNLIKKLSLAIEETNDEIINNMTQNGIKYDWLCIKNNLTYDFYYKSLKNRLQLVVEEYLMSSSKQINIDSLSLNEIEPKQFELQFDVSQNINNFIRLIHSQDNNNFIDVFVHLLSKYKAKYGESLFPNEPTKTIDFIKKFYSKFNSELNSLNCTDCNSLKQTMCTCIIEKICGLYGLSINVSDQVNNIIPEDLHSVKILFTEIIKHYYENIHPIIWAQIILGILRDIFVELPTNREEFIKFVISRIIMNSGPLIFKIIQFIKPMLSVEIAKKYDLTRLSYPMLSEKSVEMIMKKIIINPETIDIIENYSASVGHVCKVIKLDDVENPFIIKIIKPLAVTQSCWEYKILHKLFPKNTCEHDFINAMLESNGREFNILNEVSSTNKGHDLYTDNYRNVFGLDINAIITTPKNISGVIKHDCWFAFAMELAPGTSLQKLIDNNSFQIDTEYRAKLHRCLDLLVYKFFYNIVKNGFFHNDLHAGNIFFSYQLSQLTLIDFGSVSEINIFSPNTDSKSVLEIIIMSIFYNYDGILDVISGIINSKCSIGQIIQSKNYDDFKKKLYDYRCNNIRNSPIDNINQKIITDNIFGFNRISTEKDLCIDNHSKDTISDSIYRHIDKQYFDKEIDIINEPKKSRELECPKKIIIENKDILSMSNENMDSNMNVTFTFVLDLIMKFYSEHNINIAVRFIEFYNLQRAYCLLLGVLHKSNYSSYRLYHIISKSIINWSNLQSLFNVKNTYYLLTIYQREKAVYNKLLKQLID